ncbi:MAG: VOC family protein [Acidimicrobiia bacterium]|nr:VOC family protein [Acidimicrobiia bacterium]
MTRTVQVVVDCLEPHMLAAWWAETLGWQVEPQDPAFIRSMIDQGLATSDDTIEHEGALVWRSAAAIQSSDLPYTPRILFQQVPEQKTTKNRLHMDIRADDEDLDIVRATLIARGATELWEGSQGPHRWVTMADPEGNEFCI